MVGPGTESSDDELKVAASGYSRGHPDLDLGAAIVAMRATMFRLFVGSSVLFLFFAVISFFNGRRVIPGFVVTDLLVSGALLALSLWRHRQRPSLREMHIAGYAFVLFCAGHAIVASYLFRDSHDAAYIAFLVLGVGTVALDASVSIALMLIISVGAVLVTALVGRPGEWIGAAVTLVTSLLVGVTLLLGKRETLAQMSKLRAAERERSLDLARELERKEAAEARRAEVEAQLWEVQKLEAIGTLAGGVAHDINNMLAAIVGVAEAARQSLPEGSVRADFDHILAASKRGAQLTTNLLGFARRGKRLNEPLDVNEVVREVVALLSRTTPKGVRFVTELLAGPAVVVGDSSQVMQAIMNVCLNAVEALSGEGSVTVRTSRQTLAGERPLRDGRYVVVELIDDGEGMDADTLAHAFEPFRSTKTVTTHHSGLGLAMVSGALREHHGEVVLESELGRGTKVTLRIPESDLPLPSVKLVASAPTQQAAPSAPTAVDALRILVVDDEEMVRKAIARMLAKSGLEIEQAGSGPEAITCLRESPSAYAVVVLDMSMPVMNGAACFAGLRAIDPEVPILLASGYAKDQSVEALLLEGRAGFIGKPFQRAELLAAVEALRRGP